MSDVLKSFRRNAVHVRQALEVFEKDAGRVEIEGGYLQDAGLIERYKRLSIPVRRALNPTDRASFAQSLQALGETAGVDRAVLGSIRATGRAVRSVPPPGAKPTIIRIGLVG